MSARTYRAGTMKEALAQVRRDLGGDAVILATREVRRRRLLGLGTRELIEVTASGGRPARAKTRSGSPLPSPTSTPSPSAAPAIAATGALQDQFGEQLSRLHAMVED